MNDDFRNSSIDLELQVRLMNLVMGEASDFERDQLQALMEQRPELVAYCEHVEHLHGLLGEAAIGDLDQFSIGDQNSNGDQNSFGDEASTEPSYDEDSQPTWQLSADRRSQLLAVLDGASESVNNEKVCLDKKNTWWRMPPRRVAEISVVVACLFVAIGLLRPSVYSSREPAIVLGRKEFDSTGSTNWSFDPTIVQRGSKAMPADGRISGEYFNAPNAYYSSDDFAYRSSGTQPSSGHPLKGVPSFGLAVQEAVTSSSPSITFNDSGAELPDINGRSTTTNRGRVKFLAEGEPASPSGPVPSGKTSGADGVSSQDFGLQVLAERELVELRKSTTLDGLNVTNEPVADLLTLQLESKSQNGDLLSEDEVRSKNEAGTHLYNYSKGFSIQNPGVVAAEKSSAGDVAMLGRIAAGQAADEKSNSNQEVKGLEQSKALADLGTRVDSNGSEGFFDRTAGSESNRGGRPGAKADGEANGRWSVSPSASKPAEQSDFMAWMDTGLPVVITPDAVEAVQDKNPRLPAAEDDGARTIVGITPGFSAGNPTTYPDVEFDNSNTIGAAPFGGVARELKAPATDEPKRSSALGINSFLDVEDPQVNQNQSERKAQNQASGWAADFNRFGKEQTLKQQSDDLSSLLSNKSIVEDAINSREQSFLDAWQDVDRAAVPLDGTSSPVVSPDTKTWRALSSGRMHDGQVAPNTNYYATPEIEPQAKYVESLEEFSVPSDTSGSPAEPRSGESAGKAISPESRQLATGTVAKPRREEVPSKGKSDAKKETLEKNPAKKSYLEASKESSPEIVSAFENADATFEKFVPAKEPPAAIQLYRSAVNDELSASSAATSTFSLHISDVSFKLAQAALQQGQMPDASKIRIEEFVNALDYRDPLPDRQEKVSCTLEQAVHPFLMQRNLLRISMRTATAGRTQSTPLRLTILLDNSGSMERPDRRQAVLRAFQTLTQQLTDKDQVTLISFANTPRLLADKVPGNQGESLLQLVESLPSEGGTNIESALLLAREKALEQRLDAAQNRIVLMTDGAVNLGDADPTSLSKLVVQLRESGIAFDAAGICSQDLNDEVLESLTRQGDGRYYLLDSPESIGEDFAAQIAGALRPSAKNVKVQVEFNPQRVGKYKLLGFEKHRLNQEDFRNDSVDAAELAAAEAGVAVYQIQPIPGGSGDIGSVSVRFRDMATGQMIERRWPIVYDACTNRFDVASPTIRLAGTAAMLATKFSGGPQADQVDLAQLKNFIAALPEAIANQPRTQQLRTMIDQARQIAGE